jgi:hypothetical protein
VEVNKITEKIPAGENGHFLEKLPLYVLFEGRKKAEVKGGSFGISRLKIPFGGKHFDLLVDDGFGGGPDPFLLLELDKLVKGVISFLAVLVAGVAGSAPVQDDGIFAVI